MAKYSFRGVTISGKLLVTSKALEEVEPTGPTFRTMNISMWKGDATEEEYHPYVLPDVLMLFTPTGRDTIKTEYHRSDLAINGRDQSASESNLQPTIDFYVSYLDQMPESDFRTSFVGSLGYYFASDPNLNEALTKVNNDPVEDVKAAYIGLLVYTLIPTPAAASDIRQSLTMAERIKLQITPTSEEGLLSRSKVTVTDPTPSIYPWASMGIDADTPNPAFIVDNVGTSWRGATAFGVAHTLDSYDSGTNDSIQIPASKYLTPNTFYMPSVRPARILKSMDTSDNWLAFYDYYNSHAGSIGPIQLVHDETANNFVVTVAENMLNSDRAQLWIESDQDNTNYQTDNASRQIFAGEGGVPYQVLESRTYSTNWIGVDVNQTCELSWGGSSIPDDWDDGYIVATNVYDNRIVERGIAEYTHTTGKQPKRAFWYWTQVINVISNEEWPDLVQVTMRDFSTGDIVAQMNMKNAKDYVRINANEDSAWFNSLRTVEYAEDNIFYMEPRPNVWDPDTGQAYETWQEYDLPDQDKWAKDPWTDQPYKLLKGSGTSSYIMEIRTIV